ncbi:MAG: pyridoxal phosphate-dependent aminotransferase, partial [Actinomycetota bacterium]
MSSPLGSARARSVPSFHAMAMTAKASALEVSGRDICHLEVGQPGTGAPDGARRAAIAALDRGTSLGYTNARGMPALIDRIAHHYEDTYGCAVDSRRIAVVSGASAGFTLAFLACFDQGQRVGILEPGYPAYRNTLTAFGIEPVAIPVGHETQWSPTVAALDAAGPLDGLIIASPSNPTGTVLDEASLQSIASYCASNRIQLGADEIYHGLTYEGLAPTVVAIDPTAVVINSFSKYFSMTGWRLGWMVLPEHLLTAVERLQQNL